MLNLCSLTASGQELTHGWQGVIYPEEGGEGSGEQSHKLDFISSARRPILTQNPLTPQPEHPRLEIKAQTHSTRHAPTQPPLSWIQVCRCRFRYSVIHRAMLSTRGDISLLTLSTHMTPPNSKKATILP
ncbi:rCG24051, partial [Rattus norvegicus]